MSDGLADRYPDIDAEITCIDCGGVAHLITPAPAADDEFEPGEILVYRCSECLDRWDIVYEPRLPD